MPTAAPLTLLDQVVCGHVACDAAVRTQVAYVRALIDEVDGRRWPGAKRSLLSRQLDEEVIRLAQLLVDEASALPPSGVRPCVRAFEDRDDAEAGVGHGVLLGSE